MRMKIKNENIIRGTLLTLAVLFAESGCDENIEAVGEEDELSLPVEDLAGLASEEEERTPRFVHEWGDTLDLAATSPEPLFNVLSSTSSFQTFSWKKGMGPVSMGAMSSKNCFLSGFNGTLAGDGDSIAVSEGPNGEWILNGTGAAAAATATCFSTSRFGQVGLPVTAKSLQGIAITASLGSVSGGRMCFFTRVAGKFDGTTSTGVRIVQKDSQWVLQAAPALNSAVTATARCFAKLGNVVSDEVSGFAKENPQVLQSNLDRPCLLTRVSGTLASPGDWVGLWLSELQGTLRQNFGGNQFSPNDLFAATRCVTPSPLVDVIK